MILNGKAFVDLKKLPGRSDLAYLATASATKKIIFSGQTAYTFFVENYAACRQYLQQMSSVNAAVLKKYVDVETMDGYRNALGLGDPDAGAKRSTDERQVNLELMAWASSSKDLGRKLIETNTAMRIQKSYPPHLDFFLQPPMASPALNMPDFKSRFTKGLSSTAEAAKVSSYDSGEIFKFSCLLSWSFSDTLMVSFSSRPKLATDIILEVWRFL
jgi:hypothetical protein